eukprot:TRINITY_DN10671_c0_g1_i1.p1 TRINITY_DN10671_c0_g1~~TRINITY_DN10671_c0_g1_i1.p1  ORF type:complete len:882 (-),score=142.26 TRINITY_DN10671_c0_g1_i1:390-2969(-)
MELMKRLAVLGLFLVNCIAENVTQEEDTFMDEWSPPQCNGTDIPCTREGFDEDGFPMFEEYCANVSANEPDTSKPKVIIIDEDNETESNSSEEDVFAYYDYDYEEFPMCPIACGKNAKMCGKGFEGFCVPKDESCPMMCSDDKPQMCFVDDFDANGDILDYKEVCVADGAACPCGNNSKSCKFYNESFCVPSAESCPVVCTDDQKECFPVSFTSDGELDESASMEVVCTAKNETCACGTNGQLCSETDPEFGKFEWCEPRTIDGETNSCPVQCTDDQQLCVDLVFDSAGDVVDFKEQCVAANQPCPCGAESNKCTDEMGEYCLPKSFGACPVSCTEEQEYCFVDSYDSLGEWSGTEETCVAPGASCDCSKGTNSKSCTFSDPVSNESWTECIFKDEYCPVSCAAGQVQCPEVVEFNAGGEFVKVLAPTKACVSKLSECACGKEAQRCTEGDFSWCQPKLLGCPVTCKKGFKECYVDNFNETGYFKYSQAKCVKEKDPCPCGKNAKKCPDGMCFPKTEACDCKSTEKSCSIADYAKDGTVSGFRSICVAKTASCPCGKHTKRCKGTTADDDYCIAKGSKDGKGGECPQYCKPEDLASKKMNCIQTNLDDNGMFVSQVVKCVDQGKCLPGRNMKKCKSGAVISVKDRCKTLYAVSNGTKARSDDQTATLKFVMDSTVSDADAAKAAASMMVAMNSALQTPPDLATTLTIKGAKEKTLLRRLSGTGGKQTLSYTVKNTGRVPVSPQQVVVQAKFMMESISPAMKKASKSIGTIRSNGVLMAVQTTQSVKPNRTAMQNSIAPTPSPTVAPTAPTPTFAPSVAVTSAPVPDPTPAPTQAIPDAARMGAQVPALVLFLVCALAFK